MMKTKLLFAWTTLAMMFAACEEEGASRTEIIYSDDPYQVNVYAGLPEIYGQAGYYIDSLIHPVSDVLIKIYPTQQDYLLNQNVFTEGLTDLQGKFTFEYDSTGSLWFRAQKDTLSNYRQVITHYKEDPVRANEIVIPEQGSSSHRNYDGVYTTMTNTPARLQLSISHLGQPVEGASVQLYFTEQTYLDNLPAQEDLEQLKPTYGYAPTDTSTSDNIPSFINHVDENFLQTTDKEGIVVFDNLEPRNYWFRISKDTLSNESGIVSTLRPLPRNAETTVNMTVGIE